MAYANGSKQVTEPMWLHYRTLAAYLGREDMDSVISPGVWSVCSLCNVGMVMMPVDLGKVFKIKNKVS